VKKKKKRLLSSKPKYRNQSAKIRTLNSSPGDALKGKRSVPGKTDKRPITAKNKKVRKHKRKKSFDIDNYLAKYEHHFTEDPSPRNDDVVVSVGKTRTDQKSREDE
jgi:hypothetical protein